MLQKNPVELSIIVLSFNTKELTRQCLVSLVAAKTKKDLWEIIVVDNASNDGSADMIRKDFPGVTLFPQEKNLGFAAGNNVGIKKSSGRFILLLNSDTEVRGNAIQKTFEFLDEHYDVGVATCKLAREDGSVDPACHRGFPTPWASLTYFSGLERLFPKSRIFGQYHQGYKNFNEPHEIDSASGAFFMVKREVIDQVGFLDEQFFMYGEDLDWAYRIKKAGWKIMFYPGAIVLHKKWQSGRAHVDDDIRKETEIHFYESMKLFYKKHYAHLYGWLITTLVLLGIKLKSFLCR